MNKSDYNIHLINDFQIGWEKFNKCNSLDENENLDLLISVLRRKIGKIISLKYNNNYIAVYEADLSEVKTRLSSSTLICFLKIQKQNPESTDEAFRFFTTAHHAEAKPGNYTIGFLSDGDIETFKKRCKNSYMDIITLDKQQMQIIIEAENWYNALAEVMRSEESVDILSPYDEVGVCSKELFYGRKREIHQLVASTQKQAMSLVGARRVGKSSLLLAVKQFLDQRGETSFYIDCETCRNMDSFKNEIIKRTHLKDYKSFSGKDWELKDYFEERLLPQYHGVINLFLDEIDWVIKYDRNNNYQYIISQLLSTQNEHRGKLNLWLSGYKDLYWSTANYKSPLFRKTKVIELGPLDDEAAKKLIVEPLSQLGFSIARKNELLSIIIEDTNKHPALIQLTCRLLIEYMMLINKNIIELQYYRDIQEYSDYKDYILDIFIIATNPLNKVIILTQLDKRRFTLEDVDQQLTKLNICMNYENLYKELRELRFSGILRENKDFFSFNYPVLKYIIKKFVNVKFLLDKNIKRAQVIAGNVNQKS